MRQALRPSTKDVKRAPAAWCQSAGRGGIQHQHHLKGSCCLNLLTQSSFGLSHPRWLWAVGAIFTCWQTWPPALAQTTLEEQPHKTSVMTNTSILLAKHSSKAEVTSSSDNPFCYHPPSTMTSPP